jgi:hypothetical protein
MKPFKKVSSSLSDCRRYEIREYQIIRQIREDQRKDQIRAQIREDHSGDQISGERSRAQSRRNQLNQKPEDKM